MAEEQRDGLGLCTAARSVMVWTLAFAGLHSLLASRSVKEWVRRRFGQQTFNGLYRLGFNGLALITFSAVLARFSRMPDRQLYHVHRPWSLPMRLVQLAALALMLDANRRIGLGRMSGLQGFWEWIHGRRAIEQNPAQGPQLRGDLVFRTGGAFRLSRHPNNLAPLLLWVAHPRMTVRFATFTLVSGLYLLAGSIHEERRLRAAYGRQYDRYRRGKPFYFPWPR